VYSPEVPGFHIVEHGRDMSPWDLFREKVRPILTETMQYRVDEAKVGGRVRLREEATVGFEKFIPDEITRRLGGVSIKHEIPAQVIAEIT
jgi:hypothetical protein